MWCCGSVCGVVVSKRVVDGMGVGKWWWCGVGVGKWWCGVGVGKWWCGVVGVSCER